MIKGVELLSKEDIQYNLNYLITVIDKYNRMLDLRKVIKESYMKKIYLVNHFCLDFEFDNLTIEEINEAYGLILKMYYKCFTAKDKIKKSIFAAPKPEPADWREKYKNIKISK